jgi:hypothetical protein
MKEAQNNKNDRKDDQYMNPIPGFREAWADISTECTECPQDHKNYDDYPQHDISPFECSENDLLNTSGFQPGAIDLSV